MRKYLPKQNSLPGLRRRAETSGRRRFGNPGVRAGAIQSDPAGSTEAGLRVLRTDRASRSAEPSDRARHRRTGAAGARAGLEILRSLAAVSPVGDLCARRSGAGTLDAGGLGGRNEPVACAAGGSAAASRDERDTSCTPTTRRFRCWRRAMAKQKPGGCGPMCETTGQRETQHRRRCGSPTRRIARASIRRRTSAISRARCRRMVTRDSMRCTKPGAFRKRPAGRMCAGSSTICTWRTNRRSRPKRIERIAALYAIEKEIRGHPPDERREVRNTRSAAVAGIAETMAGRDVRKTVEKIRHGAGGSLRALALGSAAALRATTAASRSTTTPPNAPCAPSLWAARTTCSPAPMPAASAPPRSTA